jgi:biotin synthase
MSVLSSKPSSGDAIAFTQQETPKQELIQQEASKKDQLSPSYAPSSALIDKLRACYEQPFPELIFQAQEIQRRLHPGHTMQLCTLANIKSGNCPEDCAYCPQSARYNTGIDTWDLPEVSEIREQALAAKANGSTRFCMGAAWRTPPHQKAFTRVLELVRAVSDEGMEACVTLGMLNAEQAVALKEAGLTAYNHNIDTAPDFYPEIISTRTLADRIQTIQNVANAGISVCCGGIVGMGETVEQRLSFLGTLYELETPPESIPINCLVPVEGTPLAEQKPVDSIELARIIAVARIFFPESRIRLSAGRLTMSDETQTLCFLAGANSIFSGEKLLTTDNPGDVRDHALINKLGMVVEH